MKTIHVAAAIIVHEGKYLIGKRKEGKELAGMWEFPGGKIEKGETHKECLVREFLEEFGVQIEVGEFIARTTVPHEDKTILLHGYFGTYIHGEFDLREHEEIKWATLEELPHHDFASADIPFLEKIGVI